jgi:hypothetical protein
MKRRHVLDLRPTQFAIGMTEVEKKAKKLRRLGKKALRAYIRKHPVKVIRSPQEELYIVDKHHTLMASWLIGVKKVRVDVQTDLSGRRMSRTAFWRFMEGRRCTHLYDQFGEGPRDPLYLPVDIRGLGDDPYRSLAWLAQKKGAFEESKVRYYEFEWAQLLRQHKLLSPDGRSQLRRAVPEAVRVCRSPAAHDLPGFRGVASSGGASSPRPVRIEATRSRSSHAARWRNVGSRRA